MPAHAIEFSTADLCDLNPDGLQVCSPELRSFGGRRSMAGQIATMKIAEDNRSVVDLLQKPGSGRILVVDVDGVYCAVVGDRLATIAHDNGWSGLVVNGYIRDQSTLSEIDVGIWALGACPRRSVKRAEGTESKNLSFAGITFVPDHYLYADIDGVITNPVDLLNR